MLQSIKFRFIIAVLITIRKGDEKSSIREARQLDQLVRLNYLPLLKSAEY